MNDFSRTRRRALWVPLALLLSAGMWGCASGPSGAQSESPSKQDASPDELVKRAQTYWDLVRANNNVAAWAYEAQSKDPAWTLEGYLKKGGITYTSVKVLGVKSIEGDAAKLDVDMVYSLPLLRVREQQLRTEDQWMLIDGVWYHAPPKRAFMPTK